MNRLITLLIFSAVNAMAADVVVSSATSVLIDGVEAGKPADVIANHPQLASDIQVALESWAAQQAAAATEAQVAQKRAEAKLKLLVDGAKAALSKPTSEQRLAAGNALLAKVSATQTDDERAALLQQQAEIAAKLKALTDAQATLKP